MQIHPGSHHALRRYLTPFLSFTLGLAFILVLAACNRGGTTPPDISTSTPPPVKTSPPAQFGTQANTKSTRTPLPAVPATPNERTPSPLGVTAAQLQGLQVSLWHPWTGDDSSSLQAILDDFNRNNQWGITASARGYEGFGSLDDAVESATSSGSLPDLLVDYGYQARHWNDLGLLADMTPYVDDPVWGLTGEEQADFYPGFWAEDLVAAGTKSESTRLGVPYYRSAYVLFYNQSWAIELGYPEPPRTPEDFRVRACAAAEAVARQQGKANLGQGGWLITPEPGALAGWIYAFGGEITNPDGAGYLFNTPQTSQAFTYLKSLQKSGCAWFDPAADAQVEFASRQALFRVGSLFDIPSQREAFTLAGSTDQWEVIPFPSDEQPAVDTYGPSLLITHSTPARQLAAWLVVEWLVYPPNQARFVQQLGVYPTRQSTLSYLGNTAESSPQWAQALDLLPDAHAEPILPSWSVMRWALNDVIRQLFSQQFAADQISSLLINLDSLAQEISSQVH